MAAVHLRTTLSMGLETPFCRVSQVLTEAKCLYSHFSEDALGGPLETSGLLEQLLQTQLEGGLKTVPGSQGHEPCSCDHRALTFENVFLLKFQVGTSASSCTQALLRK